MLELFSTQITGTQNSGKSGLTGSPLTGTRTDAQAIDFWNFILGQIADEEFRADTNTTETNDNILDEKVQGEKVDLALLQLALMGQDVGVDLNQKMADLQIERIALKQENRVEQLTKLVNHLTSGLPTPPDSGTVEELVKRLNTTLENLQASLDSFRSGDFGADGSPFKLLIATGLNPAQLTEITNRIEEVENKLGRKLTVEDLIAGVGNIVPAPGDDDHEFSAPDALGLVLDKAQETDPERVQKEEEKQEEEIVLETEEQKIFENIVKDVTENQIDEASVTSIAPSVVQTNNRQNNGVDLSSAQPATISPLAGNSGATSSATAEQPAIVSEEGTRLTNAEFQEMFGGSKIGQKASGENGINNPGFTKANLQNMNHAVQNNTLTTIAPITIGDASFAQTTLSEALGFDIQTGTPFSQAAQAAHFVSTANSVAGQQHPATKMVSAQIAKSANNGETRAITLQLDPPELGRVEIRLEFGREKSVKAHLVVEKPETLLMLQRDASALEKTLQDSGLSTNGDSLSYEMATEDHAFHSGKDNQNTGSGKTGTDLESNQEDEIYTEMTWDVDPETGHVHYSILA
jgi:flagellar hook-length control protein FliK